jgi:hypothetical protein
VLPLNNCVYDDSLVACHLLQNNVAMQQKVASTLLLFYMSTNSCLGLRI